MAYLFDHMSIYIFLTEKWDYVGEHMSIYEMSIMWTCVYLWRISNMPRIKTDNNKYWQDVEALELSSTMAQQFYS